MPETTILIPTNNCGKFIEAAIKSILSQNYKDYELLIIDDGSIDNTDEVISNINDSRIVYLKNEENIGIVKTLNKGLQLAKGKYIARMDADDMMLGNRLQDQINFLNRNLEYGMVGGWYQIMDEYGKLLTNMETHTNADFLSLGLIFRNQFAHPAVTMRSALAQQLQYDTTYQYCEDHDLWIRFAEVTKVTNLPSYHLSYRWYSNNSCNRKQNELKTAVLNLLSRELDKIKIEHTSEELMLHAAVCFGIAPRLFKNYEKREMLYQWYDKIFASPILNQRYSEQWLHNFRKDILHHYCNITI